MLRNCQSCPPFAATVSAEGAPSRPRPVIRCGSRSRFRCRWHSNAADHATRIPPPSAQTRCLPRWSGCASSHAGWFRIRPTRTMSRKKSGWPPSSALLPSRPIFVLGWRSSRVGSFKAWGAVPRDDNGAKLTLRVQRLAPDHSDVLARGETCQRLVAAVMALDEPYRSTVLHRYLDGLSTKQIATLDRVTELVVRKRLSRAMHQLRARLDEGVRRRAWSLDGGVLWSASSSVIRACGRSRPWRSVVNEEGSGPRCRRDRAGTGVVQVASAAVAGQTPRQPHAHATHGRRIPLESFDTGCAQRTRERTSKRS